MYEDTHLSASTHVQIQTFDTIPLLSPKHFISLCRNYIFKEQIRCAKQFGGKA